MQFLQAVPGNVSSRPRRTFSTADSAARRYSFCSPGSFPPGTILPGFFSRTPYLGVGVRGEGGDGLSFRGPGPTPASDWLHSSARIPSSEPVPLQFSVQDLNEPSFAKVVGSGVSPGAGESPDIPISPTHHLSSAFLSLLVIWQLLSYSSITI